MGSRMPVATTTASRPVRMCFSMPKTVCARRSPQFQGTGDTRDDESETKQQEEDAGPVSPTR